MKNSQKGFVAPLLIAVIALLVVGGGVYVYESRKTNVPAVVDNTIQQSDQVQQTNTRNSPVVNQQNTPVIKTTPVSNPTPVKSTVTISSPNGQEVWVNGSQQTIRWTSKGSDATEPVQIILERKSPNDYQFWNIGTIANNQPGSGSYTWTVSSKDTTGNIVANSQYKILIGRNLAKGTGPVDESDGYFLIASPSTATPNPLSITVISPSAGSVLQAGQPYKITWSGHFERGDEIFSINSFPVGSDVYGTIAMVPIAQASCTGSGMGQWANPSTCSYTWTPTGPTPKLQISVFNNRNGDQFGSSGIFSVVAAGANQTQPSITVLSPNGGENIPYGTIYMAGDLGFTWRTSLGTNYRPTSEFYAALIDENNMVVRSDQINSKTNTGNGVYASSFIGESKIQINKKYKIRVCDEIELRKVTCDESDNYFVITN